MFFDPRLSLPTITGAGLLLFATMISAQEIPNMVGTWTSQYRAAVHDGGSFEVGEETTSLVITEQDGEFFLGVAVWELNEDYSGTSDIGEEEATGGDDGFIGIIGLDGREVTMAEVSDTGIYRGRLLDQNRLELTYIESDLGDAVLLRTVFERNNLHTPEARLYPDS